MFSSLPNLHAKIGIAKFCIAKIVVDKFFIAKIGIL